MTQLDLSDYAEDPASRRSDPDTAKAAGLAGGRARSKRAVLRILHQQGPLTDEQIADALPHLPRGSAAKRRHDLGKMGLVEQATLHGAPILRDTRAGRQPAMVWTLTGRGRFLAERLPVDDDPTPPADSQPRPVCAEPEQIIALADLIDDMIDQLDDGRRTWAHSQDVFATIANDLRRHAGQEPTST